MDKPRQFSPADLLDQSPDALIVTSVEGTILHWNRGAEVTLGYSSAEAVGQSLVDLLVPANRAAEERAQLYAAQETEFATYEGVMRRKDGSLVYVNSSTRTVRDAEGKLQYLVTNKKDVTQLKVLRDSKMIEVRYGDLLESTPDAIVIVNHTGRIVLVNGQAETMFGYARSELIGKPIEALLPPRYRDGHVGHRSSYFDQPRTRSMGAGLELHGLRKNGDEFSVEISLSPLKTEEGVLVTAAVRDITERKLFQRALQEKNLELEQASLAKDRFLASMSHELRTPLNAIIGFTGTMIMRLPGPLTDDQDKQLRTVQTSARHLLSLINELLDLAKIESGHAEVNIEAVSCQSVIEEISAALKPLAEDKGLTFEVQVPDENVVVRTDRRALSQILINLTNNAIKFTESGTVRITLEQRLVNGSQSVEVRVSDTGVGIRTEDQAKLFEAFTRVDKRPVRRQEGTGLGLHLSQKLAGLLGGRIVVESQHGRGSTFTLMFDGER